MNVPGGEYDVKQAKNGRRRFAVLLAVVLAAVLCTSAAWLVEWTLAPQVEAVFPTRGNVSQERFFTGTVYRTEDERPALRIRVEAQGEDVQILQTASLLAFPPESEMNMVSLELAPETEQTEQEVVLRQKNTLPELPEGPVILQARILTEGWCKLPLSAVQTREDGSTVVMKLEQRWTPWGKQSYAVAVPAAVLATDAQSALVELSENGEFRVAAYGAAPIQDGDLVKVVQPDEATENEQAAQ